MVFPRGTGVSARREVVLWTLQRGTAVVLALCVVVHLATIIYAVRGGLTAHEILGRTRGNYAWAIFYSTFVVAAAVHGAIGLRAIALEWLRLRGAILEGTVSLIAIALLVTGMRAVMAVVGA
jgi:fumarate reductase subunit C